MIIIFHYDEKTGIYQGQGVVSANPTNPGSPILPKNSTLIPPPTSRAFFDFEIGTWKGLEVEQPVEEVEQPVEEVEQPVEVIGKRKRKRKRSARKR